MNNDKGANLELLRNYAHGIKTEAHKGQAFRYMAQILLKIYLEPMPEAENWVNKAIESHRRNDMMFDLAQDYALYAELFKQKGDLPKAKENLAKAIEIFRECGADGWVKKYKEEMVKLA